MADEFKANEVGERYANALFGLAQDSDQLDTVHKDLESLGRAIGESADLRRLIQSPAFNAEDKSKALGAVAERLKASPLTLKFLGLITQNRRADALTAVIASFRRRYDRHRGVVAAEVTTAVALSKAQAKGLAKTLALSLGGQPEVTALVDPSILGGLKVRVGSRLYDASLKTKLDSLKFALKRA